MIAELDAVVGDRGSDLELWAENLRTVDVFCALSSQWLIGPAGIVGLRYEGIPFVLRMLGIPRADWIEIFHGLRIMETEVLEQVRNQ